MKQKTCKMAETLANGYSSDDLRVLSESYPMNTNMTWVKWFSKIFAFLCLTEVESALEGLRVLPIHTAQKYTETRTANQ